MHDVLIAGAGPVGAVLANLLAARGIDVAMVESQTAIYDKPRAITIDHEVMRVFQACGIANRILPGTAAHPGTDFIGVDGTIIKRFDPLPAPHPLGWAPTGFFVQPQAEALLREELAAKGVPLYLGAPLTGLEQRRDKVVAALGGDRPRTLEARYLVACDGANSFVRRLLGITLEDLEFDEWWMVVDARLTGEAELPVRCRQYCWPDRPATFLPYTGDLRRWEIKLLPSDDPAAFGDMENVRRQLARFVDPDAVEIWRSAVYRFHALLAQGWRQQRVLLAGDACHQMPPFLGQGLCAGIRDAANLAWKLEAVLRRSAPDTLLDTYEIERRPHVAAVVRRAKEFGLIIGELDRDAALQRDARLSSDLREGRTETIRQKYIPDLAAGLVDAQTSPAAGALFVQPRVKTGSMLDSRLLDGFLGNGFLLVATDAEALGWLDEEAQETWRRLGGECLVISPSAAPAGASSSMRWFVESDGLFTGWASAHDCKAAIVRPDKYVYGVASDPQGLMRLLHALAGALLGEAAEVAA